MRAAGVRETGDEPGTAAVGDDYDFGSGSAGGAVDEAVGAGAGFADAGAKERTCQRRMDWTRGR